MKKTLTETTNEFKEQYNELIDMGVKLMADYGAEARFALDDEGIMALRVYNKAMKLCDSSMELMEGYSETCDSLLKYIAESEKRENYLVELIKEQRKELDKMTELVKKAVEKSK